MNTNLNTNDLLVKSKKFHKRNMRGRRHVRFRVMRGRGPCGLVLVATKATAERTSAALAVGVMEIPLLIPARARAPSHSHLPPDISQQRARPGGRASHAQSPPRRPAGGPSALPQIPIARRTGTQTPIIASNPNTQSTPSYAYS